MSTPPTTLPSSVTLLQSMSASNNKHTHLSQCGVSYEGWKAQTTAMNNYLSDTRMYWLGVHCNCWDTAGVYLCASVYVKNCILAIARPREPLPVATSAEITHKGCTGSSHCVGKQLRQK